MENVLLQGDAFWIEERKSNLSESSDRSVSWHNEVEVYVDDMMVKSETREGHFEALDKFLARLKKYNLRLNPKKCILG